MKFTKSLFLLSAVLFLASCSSDKTTLQLNLEKGKEYNITTKSTINTNQEFMGQANSSIMHVDGTLSFLVTAVNDDSYDMEAKYTHIGMSIQSDPSVTEFNSEKDDTSDMVSTIFKSLMNKKFNVTMSKTGKILEVNNVEDIWNDAFLMFPDLSSEQKEEVKAQLIESYGAESIKGNLEGALAIFPKNAVNKGDSWENTTVQKSGITAETTTTYELSEITPEYAVIKGKGNINTKDPDKYFEMNGMEMKYDLNGPVTSEIKVDRTTGWIIQADLTQNMSGSIHVKGTPEMPEGVDMKMTMNSEITVTD